MAKKKITIYALIFFIALFSALNFRFIESQISFYLSKNTVPVTASEEIPARLLPVIAGPTTVLGQASKNTPSANSLKLFLKIPSLNISAPIIIETSTNPNNIYDKLQEGVVHYGTSPMPGDNGTSIILGHSSAYPWYKGNYGSVFALLNKLQPGDTFQVQKGEDILNYKISGSLVFSPLSDSGQLAEFERSNGSSILLVSCWPVGTNYKRLAVKADLI